MNKPRAGVEIRKEMALELLKESYLVFRKVKLKQVHYIMEIKHIFLSDLLQLISII